MPKISFSLKIRILLGFDPMKKYFRIVCYNIQGYLDNFFLQYIFEEPSDITRIVLAYRHEFTPLAIATMVVLVFCHSPQL